MLQVRAVEIPEEGLALKVSDPSWFPEREVARQGSPRVDVFLARRNERVFLSGAIDLVMLRNCDRCLEEFALPRHMEFEVVFDLSGEDPTLLVREYECDINEMDVVFLAEPVIDLGAVLSQQVILAVPGKSLCRSDCRGICPVCGADRNKKNCSCAAADGDSPFGVLNQLTKKKNSR